MKDEGDNEVKDISELSTSEPVPSMLSCGNCLKAGTIQALLYRRAKNLLYKTGCLHSPCVSCASVEPSEVYQINKIPHSALLKTMDKRKQSKASYSRDHKFMCPVNLFRSFNFTDALSINLISRTGSFIRTKIFFLRYLQTSAIAIEICRSF